MRGTVVTRATLCVACFTDAASVAFHDTFVLVRTWAGTGTKNGTLAPRVVL
jgi:hypothetical protein